MSAPRTAPHPATARTPVVFVYGYYGCANLGDELLLSSTVSGIHERWPEARFRVRNLGPIAPEPRFGPLIEATAIERILLQPGTGRARRAASYLRAFNRAMRGCHCLVLGGGTLLHAKSGLASLALLTAVIALARLRGLHVVALGLGVADLDAPAYRALARLAAAMIQDIAVRDAASAALLPVKRPPRVTADLVFGWWPRASESFARTTSATSPGAIAISIWSVPPRDESRLLTALAAMLATLARRGHAVRLVVFQDADADSGGLSDRPAFARLSALLAVDGITSSVVRPAADPDSIAETFRDVALHCGTRFHGVVLASLQGVPTVGIASDPKVSSLCSDLALPHMTPAEVTTERLLAAADAQIGKRIPPPALDALRRRSIENFAWFEAHRRPPGAA